MRLKICDSNCTCKVAHKCLNVREWVEVVEWNKKKIPSLPLLSRELSVSVKENPDRKTKQNKTKSNVPMFRYQVVKMNEVYYNTKVLKVFQKFVKCYKQKNKFFKRCPNIEITWDRLVLKIPLPYHIFSKTLKYRTESLHFPCTGKYYAPCYWYKFLRRMFFFYVITRRH